jgi:V8-like Glu-specific endopeptidase
MTVMGAPVESPWWDDPDFDWTWGSPGELLSLLASFYPDGAAVTAVTQDVQLDVQPVPDIAVLELWQEVLKQAAIKKRFPALMERLLEDQSGKESHPLIASLRDSLFASPASPSSGPVSGLQAVTSAGEGLGDAVACVQALLNLIWRTAVVRIEGHESGTGFLVGENLVLTAAHVVEAANHASRVGRSIVAVFDFNGGGGQSHAETGSPVRVHSILCSSPPTPGERGQIRGKDWEAPPDHLDFALLQLAESVPKVCTIDGMLTDRGYYVLDPDPYRFDLGSMLIVAQYPLRDFLKLSYITRPPQVNSLETRIKYTGNTLQGSSGGPMVDTRGRLVALHHYSTAKENHGVPMSAIAQKLKSGPYAGLFEVREHSGAIHIGRYSADAGERVCEGIADDYQCVADELSISVSISNAHALWNYLSSNGTLFKLRGALARLGYSELVYILDYDLTKIDRSRIASVEDQASRLAQSIGRARTARGVGDLLASTTIPRHLAARLGRDMDSLPALQDHPFLALQWRMNWSGEFGRAKASLGKLVQTLPASKAHARRVFDDVSDMIAHAQEIKAAAIALHGLARSPVLSL